MIKKIIGVPDFIFSRLDAKQLPRGMEYLDK